MSEIQAVPLKDTKVFQPIQVGKNVLSNRIFYAASTRTRALEEHTPSDLQLRNYDERTRYPGSLVVTEATFSFPQAGALPGVPGVYTPDHTNGWKKIVDRVHENKSFIAIQLWNLGRLGSPKDLKRAGLPYVAPSAIYENENTRKEAEAVNNPLRALTEEEIHDQIYNQYTAAAKNSVAAGFDYLELHAAHGYLLHQFLEDTSNQRTDKYGGSVENRARFVLELIDHLIPIVGAEKLAIRISPWVTMKGMPGIHGDTHPLTTYSYLLHELEKRAQAGNRLAYVSVVEPRVNGAFSLDAKDQTGDNGFVEDIWKGTILKAGNYTYDAPEFRLVVNDVANDRTLVGFSRYYIANPDLVQRLHDGLPLKPYDRSLFYRQDDWGYNTYPYEGQPEEEIEAAKNRKPRPIGNTEKRPDDGNSLLNVFSSKLLNGSNSSKLVNGSSKTSTNDASGSNGSGSNGSDSNGSLALKVRPLGDTKVFEPIQVGKNTLSNRIFMCPTTRLKALDDGTPSNLALQLYEERSKFPGSLLTAEGTYAFEEGLIYPRTPGIFTERHVEAWKKIVDRVHKNKSFISLQLYNAGRVANPLINKDKKFPFAAASAIYLDEKAKEDAIAAGNPLRELTLGEIDDLINNKFPKAAKNALSAGFDYVEVHAANGYLLNQFLDVASNKRTDKYGGSIENRARIVLEVIDKLTTEIGADKVGVRISPWSTFQGMLTKGAEIDPLTTYSYFLHELEKRAQKGNRLAYVSIIEPRADGSNTVKSEDQVGDNSFVYDIWKGTVLRAGGYTYDAPAFHRVEADVANDRTLIGFCRYYISNPDLVERLKNGWDLQPYDRPSFYRGDDYRYNTYSFHGEPQRDEEAGKNRKPEPIAIKG